MWHLLIFVCILPEKWIALHNKPSFALSTGRMTEQFTYSLLKKNILLQININTKEKKWSTINLGKTHKHTAWKTAIPMVTHLYSSPPQKPQTLH